MWEKNSRTAYRCMTHDVYIVKTRTNKHKHTDVYVNDGYGLQTVSVVNSKRSIVFQGQRYLLQVTLS